MLTTAAQPTETRLTAHVALGLDPGVGHPLALGQADCLDDATAPLLRRGREDPEGAAAHRGREVGHLQAVPQVGLVGGVPGSQGEGGGWGEEWVGGWVGVGGGVSRRYHRSAVMQLQMQLQAAQQPHLPMASA